MEIFSERTWASILALTACAVLVWLFSMTGLALAAPLPAGLSAPESGIVQVKIFQRGRPPQYPYVYKQGRPGGWDFYGGFMPYQKGNYEIQSLQRVYPESNYPPSMTYPTTPFQD